MPFRLIVATLAMWVGVAGADDVLHPGAVVLDRPTLRTAGIQLLVSGDDDHDARVAVRYRRSGDPAWRSAMDLFRVRPEHVVGRTVPEQFAGGIFELEPGATYDVELHATDPDGPVDATIATAVTLRTVPGDPVHPVVRPVADADALDAALAAAQPGDVITLADGVYSGAFTMFASGTAADPIVIRGASTDGVVLDGRGCSSCNVLEAYGSFVHVERLTLQHANRAAFRASARRGTSPGVCTCATSASASPRTRINATSTSATTSWRVASSGRTSTPTTAAPTPTTTASSSRATATSSATT
jgi:hypothetical protein